MNSRHKRRHDLHPLATAAALANLTRARGELSETMATLAPTCDLYRLHEAAHDALTALARALGEDPPLGGSGTADRWSGPPKR